MRLPKEDILALLYERERSTQALIRLVLDEDYERAHQCALSILSIEGELARHEPEDDQPDYELVVERER